MQGVDPEGRPTGWHSRGRGLFLRFTLVFGFLVILVVGSMAAVAFVITRLLGGSGPTAILTLIGGLALAFALPALAAGTAMMTFRRIAVPLADVMAAAEAVAEGDLEARVPESGRGAFDRLARSFNTMV